MPALINSQRRLYKATYAPIICKPMEPAPRGRGLAKTAFIASLAMHPSEMEQVKFRLRNAEPGMEAALAAVEALVLDRSPAAALRQAKALAEVSPTLLLRIGHALIDERTAVAARVETLMTHLREGYRSSVALPLAPAADSPSAPTAAQPVPARTIEARDAQGRLVRMTHNDVPASTGAAPSPRRMVIRAEVVAPRAEAAPATAPAGSIEDAIAWAGKHQPDAFKELHALAVARAPVSLAYSNAETALAVSHMLPKVADCMHNARAAVHAFREHMKIEPVGRLHLERLEMTPVGVERGELVSSIPLTPKETVNISHREWAVTTEEFESIIRDSFEGYSEQGVVEKCDVAQSTENQARHASALSVGASASTSYLGVTLSSSLGYGSTSDDQQARKDSRNHSIASTRGASARVRKDHKISFRTSSVAGTEDRAVRVITNPSDIASMRVDYYQLMRKWRVDLYRYGLRMTYDIVIPSPGADLLRKIKDLNALDAEINTPLIFNLKPGDITRGTWEKWAAYYQASVDSPPKEKQSFMASADVQKSTDDKDKFFVGAVEFDVDNDYEVSSGEVLVQYYHADVGDDDFALLMDVQFDATPQVINQLFDKYKSSAIQWGILGRSGHLSVGYFHRGVVAAKITVNYTVTLRDDVFRAWQFRVWASIRTAAEQQYLQSRQQLKDQRAALVTEIAPFDALTLRRMELEEVEKGVLRWLFGPSFNVAPANIQSIIAKMAANDPLQNDALDPSVLSNEQWQRMMEFGEFIKYVQQAIEWENVLYFTYPYFWDTPKNWTIKQFLQHPDALHRTFLRAGSARVVLTIRPGFESSFAQLIETGAFGELPGDHPYVTIAQEIQDYANTNYPGIPPANPANPPDEQTVNDAERGKLQATWWEYTPTSALDVALNTSLPEMA
jgi:hypothetical protein